MSGGRQPLGTNQFFGDEAWKGNDGMDLIGIGRCGGLGRQGEGAGLAEVDRVDRGFGELNDVGGWVVGGRF